MARDIYRTIDNIAPDWFIFGETNEGLVDIADGKNDVLTNISKENANIIIDERNKLTGIITRLSEELRKHKTLEEVDKFIENKG